MTIFDEEFDWLIKIAKQRLWNYNASNRLTKRNQLWGEPAQKDASERIMTLYENVPSLTPGHPYHDFIAENGLSPDDRIMLALAIAPNLNPDILNWLLDEKDYEGNPLRFIGGVSGRHYKGFVPTGGTWLFLAGGSSTQKRIELLRSLHAGHPLVEQKVVVFLSRDEFEPVISGPLISSEDFLRRMIS